MRLVREFTFLGIVIFLLSSCSGVKKNKIHVDDIYPWCIVAYDSLERTPTERIAMIKELGFTKYAYDWRNRHLDSASAELNLARDEGVEIISVWLWLNPKRDSIGKLSEYNERLLRIVKELELETTIWLGMSKSYFVEKDNNEALKFAQEMVEFVAERAKEQGCEVALCNHTGWFGDPRNQLAVLEVLPEHKLTLVFNFHHSRDYIEEFPLLAKTITPHLSAVNLNCMAKAGEKIMPVGSGEYENMMIQALFDAGYHGPWGILGHVEGVDVRLVLEQNIVGLNELGVFKGRK